jgi:glucose-1-phosphate thymidylyltransferase
MGGETMKAIVLCAGKGTRLRPLTHTTAKHLIPVANKPVLFYSLETIKHAGITDVALIVSPHNRDIFKDAIGNGESFGMRIEYVVQEEPKGLAHAVWVAKDFLNGDDFLMYLGDNLIMEDLKPFVEDFKKSNVDASILLTPVDDPRRFGVAVVKNGEVVKVIEKPKEPPSNLAIVGVYMFKPVIFEGIENIKPSWRGELEITDAIEYLIEHGYRVKAHVIYGWWKDTGKPDDLLAANRKILEGLKTTSIRGEVDERSTIQGNVEIGEGSVIVNSVLRGPVVIGKGSIIKNSYIGPYTSVGNKVSIDGCEVENSIVMEESVLVDVPERIDDSIIGKGVKVTKGERKPKSLRLILGDLSSVELP